MGEWDIIRKKCIVIEIIGMMGMALSLVIGVFCEWEIYVYDKFLISVEDIDSFSLTILQIQATVGTLIVAIVALITGNISDSYMGVSVSDFYLNIKPWKLKQRIIIFISLGLCLAGVIFHSLKLYNIVFYLFIATLIVISLSIMEVYSAFKGRNAQNMEIEAYIRCIVQSDIGFEKKLSIYQSFVSDWKKEVNAQDKQSYEKYLEIFRMCMLAMWDYETDESLASIQQQCYNMSYCLLGSDKNTTKERGIEFIQNVYDVLWSKICKCIANEKFVLNKYKNGFSLFAEICDELRQSMDTLNVENVEKRIRFSSLEDTVQRVAIWLGYDSDEDKENDNENGYRRYKYDYTSEIGGLNLLAKYIGYYLGKQQDKNNTININIWADALNKWSIFSSYNVPEEKCETFLKSKVRIYCSYCYGLLVNRQENIVKQGLYLTGMNTNIKLYNKHQVIFYIAVHCYIYYLAVRESGDCVSENVRKSAINIWEDENVKKAFLRFLVMLADRTEWLDLNVPDQIYEAVRGSELLPKYGLAKEMILEDVVIDFYLFLILFMDHQYYLPELLEKNIDDMRAFEYVSDRNEHITKELFISLFKMIYIGDKSEEQISVEVDLMYDLLEKMVKKKQKERHIKLAREKQEKYELYVNEEEICEKIKNDISQRLKEKFAPILIDEDKKNGIIRVDLLNFTDFTDSLGKRSIDGYYSHIDGRFLFHIEDFLRKRKVVEMRKRFGYFENDKEFMKFLDTHNLHLLLGSPYYLKNKDYRYTDEYNKFVEDYETIYTAYVNNGIALKENTIQVCLHDINVSIHSLSIREANVRYDKTARKYRYSIWNGLPIDFEENELREFLYNNHKVMNITAKISIQINEIPAGIILL